jgi:cysteine desulfurase
VIYLDNHATTPCDRRTADRIHQLLTENFGNASSTDHEYGDRAATAIKESKQAIAQLLNAPPRDILFTSGATESLNLAIQGTINALASHPSRSSLQSEGLPRIACSPVEHSAVLDTCHSLQKQNRITLIPLQVDSQANLDLTQIEQVCASGLDLLCIMAANNEVGTIYPIQQISAIAQRHQVPFLCDATQSVGKIPIQFNDWGITMLALSAHKLYGPKGIGALIIRNGHRLKPLLYGGSQQHSLRPGTLNVPGIVGLGEACRLRQLEMLADETEIARKRDKLQNLLQKAIPGLILNGNLKNRLAGNLHIAIPGIPNDAVIARVRHKLAISTGAACSSGVETPSHVLTAMNLPEDVIEGSLRIGLGKFTTDDEVDQAAEILIHAVQKIRMLMDV